MIAPRLPLLLPALLASTSYLSSAYAHGGHGHGDSYDEHGAEDASMGYAERHVSTST